MSHHHHHQHHHLLAPGKVPPHDMPSDLPMVGGGAGGMAPQAQPQQQSMLLPTVANAAQPNLDVVGSGWQQPLRPGGGAGHMPLNHPPNPTDSVFGLHISMFGGLNAAQIESMDSTPHVGGGGTTSNVGGGGKLPTPTPVSVGGAEVFSMHHHLPVERNSVFGMQFGGSQLEGLDSPAPIGTGAGGGGVGPIGGKLPPVGNSLTPLEAFHQHHHLPPVEGGGGGGVGGALGGGTVVTPSTSYIVMAPGVFSGPGRENPTPNSATFTSAGRGGGATGGVVPIGTERAQKATLSAFPISSGFSTVWSYSGDQGKQGM